MKRYERPILTKTLGDVTVSEKGIIKFINSFQGRNFGLTQKELADKTFTSEASVSRFAKRMGFKTYRDMVLFINQQINLFTREYPLGEENTIEDSIKNLINVHLYAIAEGLDRFEIQKIVNTAELIHNAKEVAVWGIGSSWKPANELAVNLQRVGIPSFCPMDFHTFLPAISFKKERRVLIVFSNNFRHKEMWHIVKAAKAYGWKVVLVTSNAMEFENIDVKILYKRYHSDDNYVPISSKTVQNMVGDIIFNTLLKKYPVYEDRIKEAMGSIYKWEKYVSTKLK